jgi:hypothetical protein
MYSLLYQGRLSARPTSRLMRHGGGHRGRKPGLQSPLLPAPTTDIPPVPPLTSNGQRGKVRHGGGSGSKSPRISFNPPCANCCGSLSSSRQTIVPVILNRSEHLWINFEKSLQVLTRQPQFTIVGDRKPKLPLMYTNSTAPVFVLPGGGTAVVAEPAYALLVYMARAIYLYSYERGIACVMECRRTEYSTGVDIPCYGNGGGTNESPSLCD